MQPDEPITTQRESLSAITDGFESFEASISQTAIIVTNTKTCMLRESKLKALFDSFMSIYNATIETINSDTSLSQEQKTALIVEAELILQNVRAIKNVEFEKGLNSVDIQTRKR